ncbi:MAG: helix-turn-helix domain-containing protein, partial [Clostridia bacterium]|nr:helix-turn-helix domain-containing protein [Clostridia bacterium]
MNKQIQAIAERLKALREICDISVQEMAGVLDITENEYRCYENGERDFAFSFLMGSAEHLGVDMVELLTGDSPRLSSVSFVKKGEGLYIVRRSEYKYQHLAYFFKDKRAEPFHVRVTPEDNSQMHLNTHDGQEFNYILSGSMEIEVDGVRMIATEG